MKDFINDKKIDKTISSSVMDYLPFFDSVLIGEKIKNNEQALKYDEFAINFLYKNQKDNIESPLFCTDSHVGVYGDCDRFIIGKDPITFAKWSMEKSIKNIPEFLKKHLLDDSHDSLEKKLNYASKIYFFLSYYLMRERLRAMSTLGVHYKLLTVEKEINEENIVSEDEINSKYNQHITNLVNKNGGWNKVLDHLPNNFSEEMNKNFMHLINEDQHTKELNYTEEQINNLTKATKNWFDNLEKICHLLKIIPTFSLKKT